MRRLNLKVVGSLLLSITVLVVGVHFLHAYQVSRNAGILLVQAEEARTSGQMSVAIEKYGEYLKHRDDSQAYLQLAELLSDAAMSPQATRGDILRVRLFGRSIAQASRPGGGAAPSGGPAAGADGARGGCGPLL